MSIIIITSPPKKPNVTQVEESQVILVGDITQEELEQAILALAKETDSCKN